MLDLLKVQFELIQQDIWESTMNLENYQSTWKFQILWDIHFQMRYITIYGNNFWLLFTSCHDNVYLETWLKHLHKTFCCSLVRIYSKASPSTLYGVQVWFDFGVSLSPNRCQSLYPGRQTEHHRVTYSVWTLKVIFKSDVLKS